jgi:L1 cell adhesion molecule like protein
MNAAEDFLLLLLHAHSVAAAKTVQAYNPTYSAKELAGFIAVNFVDLSMLQDNPLGSELKDEVHLYGKEFLTLTLLWHGFHDAIREGDGDRILRYWKFMLIIFKSSGKKNYGKEAVNLLLQYYYIFSERQKEELLWSRCVNTKGYQGANIPGDLHMEHLNRRVKIAVRHIGANIKPKSIERAGKCVGVVQNVCLSFERQTASLHSSDHHPIPALGKDFSTVLKVLEEESIFVPRCERKHASFDMKKTLLNKFTRKQLCSKIETNIDQIIHQ